MWRNSRAAVHPEKWLGKIVLAVLTAAEVIVSESTKTKKR
jgi:hypothetical protein